MNSPLKLMCILAHPDDESLGTGGVLAKYAAEGMDTSVICATLGQRGRFGMIARGADPDELGRVRESELRAATKVLGVKETISLGLMDGDVDRAEGTKVIAEIAAHIRRLKPHVVITFGPDGAYGHPDHIAISQFAAAAIAAAASEDYSGTGSLKVDAPSHVVSKLYYMVWSEGKWGAFEQAFRKLVITVDGVERQASPWQEWQITTVIDTYSYWRTAWEAIQCHQTQVSIYEKLADLPEKNHIALWGSQEFYRVFSLVNSGRSIETDLFSGLR